MTPEQNALIKSLETREEIFDYVEAHLKKQGYRSMLATPTGIPTTVCAYRGVDGAACAVGCLIADDEYNPGMENNSVMELADLFGTTGMYRESALPERLIPHAKMLEALQDLHDRSANWTSGKGLSHRGIDHLRHLRRLWLTSDLV